MSEYLTNLLMRTFDPKPAIRPRLAPIFAPAGPGPGWPASTPEGRESAATVPPNPAPSVKVRSAPAPESGKSTETDDSLGRVPSPIAAAPRDAASSSNVRSESAVRGSDSADDPSKELVKQEGAAATGAKPSERSARAQRYRIPQREISASAPQQLIPPPAEQQGVRDERAPRPLGQAAGVPAMKGEAERPAAGQPPTLDTLKFEREVKHITDSPRDRHPRAPAHERTPLSIVRDDIKRLYSQARQDPGARDTRPPAQALAIGTTVSFEDGDRKPAFLTGPPRRPHARDEKNASSDGVPQLPRTIEVTIGRIEVRAATTAEPRRRSQSSPAGLSLEEYLRRRSGGGGP